MQPHRPLDRPPLRRVGIWLLLGWLGLAACGSQASPDPLPPGERAFLERAAGFLLEPPPPDSTNRWSGDEAAARFGMQLFADPGLSGDGLRSCLTCHNPDHGFADPRGLSHGMGPVARHAPTLIDAVHGHWFGWGGKADSLWSQALGPLEHPAEMGGDRLAIAHHLAADPERKQTYQSLFGPLPDLADGERFPPHGMPESADPGGNRAVASAAWEAMDAADRTAINRVFSHVGKALAAYESRLLAGPSPFDRKVLALQAGDAGPVPGWDAAAARGFDLFIGAAQCVVCHSGPRFSDGEFHNTGAPPWHGGEPMDPGRYQDGPLLQASDFRASGAFSDDTRGQRAQRTEHLKTGSEQWGEFKTPSLRNLLVRAPYMHQGQFPTLEEVIEFYDTREGSVGQSHHQEKILRPLGLTGEQRADLLAFLGSLQGAPVPALWAHPGAR